MQHLYQFNQMVFVFDKKVNTEEILEKCKESFSNKWKNTFDDFNHYLIEQENMCTEKIYKEFYGEDDKKRHELIFIDKIKYVGEITNEEISVLEKFKIL